MSSHREARLGEAGRLVWGSTFGRAVRAVKRARDTGPDRKTRELVRQRSGGMCEWPGCMSRAVDQHHRLGRKAGGRRGDMAGKLNSPANLLHCCRHHHRKVTSAVGLDRSLAVEWGWLLYEGEDPPIVPVRTAHGYGYVLLDNAGGWRYP